MLTSQGKKREEIADILLRSLKTIDNEISLIFKKLDVNSILQALIYSTNHGLIFDNSLITNGGDNEKPIKKNKITPDLVDEIKKRRKSKYPQSINSIANEFSVPASTIRNWIKKGKI